MLGSYLSTFLDSFLSKENLLRSHLRTRKTVFDIDSWFQKKAFVAMKKCISSPSLNTTWWPGVENLFTFLLSPSLLGIKWVYPSSGVPFSTKGYRYVIAKVIAKLEHFDDQERKEECRTKRTTEKTEGERKEQEKETKEEETTDQTWNRWNSEQDS